MHHFVAVGLLLLSSQSPHVNRSDVSLWAHDVAAIIAPCNRDFLTMNKALRSFRSVRNARAVFHAADLAAPAAHRALASCSIAFVTLDPPFMSESPSDQKAIHGDARILSVTSLMSYAMRDIARAAQDIVAISANHTSLAPLDDIPQRMDAATRESDQATAQVQVIVNSYL